MPVDQKIPQCVRSVEQSEAISLDRVAQRLEPSSILMCEPTYFEVKDAKNPFMSGHEGKVDLDLAQKQWRQLKETFESCGYPVHVIEPVDGFEDMVFAANQVLVGKKPPQALGGTAAAPYVVPAQMAFPSRQREIPYYLRWFEKRGYQVLPLPNPVPGFEGHGDAIWHPGKQMLWLGYGNRTEARAGELLSTMLDVPVVMLQLATPTFYHLDTCFAALDEQTVLIYPRAFTDESLRLIKRFFANVIEVSEKDAFNFAGNAVTLKRNVVLQKGSSETVRDLRLAGFQPIEVDTSEYMKSGGSAFCMKMMVY